MNLGLLPDRFWDKVHFSKNGCWEWTAANVRGYGHFGVNRRNVQVHRLTYVTFVGEIPAGLQIDHLCRNKCCCNPFHLEPVTPRENTIRERRLRTSCPAGHAYTETNTFVRNGQRSCRECQRLRVAAWKAATGYKTPPKSSNSDAMKRLREKWKARGLCTRCGGTKVGDGCPSCRVKRGQYRSNKRLSNPNDSAHTAL